MFNKLKLIILSALTVVSLSVAPVFAQSSTTNTNSTNTPTSTSTNSTSAGKCGSTKTQLISCDSQTGIGAISDLIKMAIMVLTILIGVVAVGGIAYAAILYAGARDDQSQVSNARTILRNIVIGLLLYGFTIAIINWLIPGGVIG